MRYRMTLGAIAFAVVGALLPATVRAQDIGPGVGVYRLTAIDEHRMPVVVDIDDEARCREELFSAVLTLRANGTWNLVSRERKVCDGDLVKDVDEEFDGGTFTVDGSTVTFFDEDGQMPRDRSLDLDRDEIELDDLGVGTLSRDALSVRLEVGVVAIFRK